jgi:hypothetical protein
MTKKKLKYGGYSLLITALFLAAVILLNVFAGMLTERFFLKADLTDTGIYSLTDRAAEVLRGIGETIDIVVLSEESTLRASMLSRVADILNNYAAASGGRIRIQYVNPDLGAFNGPKYENSLSVLRDAHIELEGMERNDILFISSRRAARVNAANLFVFNRDPRGQAVITGVRADQELVSALLHVMNERVARAVFTEGHMEDEAERLRFIFDRSGYAVTSVNLALEDIPEDTVLLISAGPKVDFMNEEIVKLEQYLSLGGSVMILYDFAHPSLPNLSTFMAQWGVSVENKLVFDTEYSYPAQFAQFVPLIGAQVKAGALPSLPDAEEFSARHPLGVPRPRPLRSEWAGDSLRAFHLFPLIQTFSGTSYAKDLDGDITTWERESGDESGPFVLAYHVRHLTSDANNRQVNANLIVAGMDMFSDAFLSFYGQHFYNIPLLSDLANDLNPFGESVFIPSKLIHDSAMPVSAGGVRTILILMVIALPLSIMLVGILVWRKRRHQ